VDGGQSQKGNGIVYMGLNSNQCVQARGIDWTAKNIQANHRQTIRPKLLLVIFALLSQDVASAQTSPKYLQQLLSEQIQPSSLVEHEIRHLLINNIPKLPSSTSVEHWTAEAGKIREHLLNDIVYHGWPYAWVNAPPNFEDLGLIESEKGYRLRKLRYQIIPGFQSTAILYEPQDMTGEIPAILDLSGHVPEGKAVEYTQKRCINYAKRGILTLSMEWFGYGELSQPENEHGFAAHLDLVGANAIGLFYLAMRRGLDYLYSHPHVDRNRLGVTGLSGGGWQTIVLSALDERVTVSVPVAGYGSLMSNIWHPGDTAEIEEDATDFRYGQDYTTLTAMRAPRSTLLIYNAEDDCCFRAPFVKEEIYDDIKPFFRLFGKADEFAWHENTDPGTHNYQLDNRQYSYQFFDKYFNLSVPEREIPADTEIKSYQTLVVGLPPNNLTVLGIAKKLAEGIKREPVPSNRPQAEAWFVRQRAKLETVVRYHPVLVQSAWKLNNTRDKGVETISYRFELSNGLSATGVWLKAIVTPDNAPATIVLNDAGKKATALEVSNRINRGEQVVSLDLLFTGDETPENPSPAEYAPSEYALLLASTGDRPIGLESAQLIALAQRFAKASGKPSVRLETTGMRSQAIALIASAIEPELFSEVVIRHGITSLAFLLDAPVAYRIAPDLFCLDLYKEFDLDRLAALTAPTKVSYLDEKRLPFN
jgi:dienelactone hydrolase